MIIFLTIVSIILILIAIFDFETEEIPHSLTLILLGLGIFDIIKFAESWYVPLIIALIFFVIYAMMFFFTNKIGGGDVKILSISFLFLQNLNMTLIYAIVFSVCLMVGVCVMMIKKKEGLRLGPYMSFGLIGTFLYYFTSVDVLIIGLLAYINLIMFIDNIFFSKRKVIENAKIFEINKI